MGKRSDFARNENDYYPTPYEAILPLLPYIVAPYSARGHKANFVEPCAGDGRLVRFLEKHGHKCVYACDIDPKSPEIEKADAVFFDFKMPECDLIITNPPWERQYLHTMIDKFRNHAPTWLLFDTDWAFTGQAIDFLQYCQMIVTVGRISWMQNGVSGMDNCAWYLFGKEKTNTIFKGKNKNLCSSAD